MKAQRRNLDMVNTERDSKLIFKKLNEYFESIIWCSNGAA